MMSVVADRLRPFHGQEVLDAGCGDGRFCHELCRENVRLTGADYSEQALLFARAFNPGITFVAADLKDLHLPASYDAIVLIEVLEHFPPQDVQLILRNLALHLKPEGQLIVTVPSVNLPVSPKHYQHFNEMNLHQTLEGHFIIREITGYGRLGARRFLYENLRRIGLMIYFLEARFKLIDRYYEFLDRYYRKHLALGPPAKCRGLMAICGRRC